MLLLLVVVVLLVAVMLVVCCWRHRHMHAGGVMLASSPHAHHIPVLVGALCSCAYRGCPMMTLPSRASYCRC